MRHMQRWRVGLSGLMLACVASLAACGGFPSASTATTPPTAVVSPTPTLQPSPTLVPTPVISANCQDALGQRGRILDRNGVVLAYSVKDSHAPDGWRRHYTLPSLSPTIGYFSPIYGVTGIESFYNQTLSGQSVADCGADVYLSIDSRIQTKLDQAFGGGVVAGLCPASSVGSVIAEDPRNGQILGMLSRPYFNADTLNDPTPAADNPKTTVGAEYWAKLGTDGNAPLLNRPLQGLYPPGSSFKTLTLIAGLDSGQYTPQTNFSKADATSYTVNGFVINSNNLDAYTGGPVPPSFPLNVQHAYAYSDNVVFARMGVQLGADLLTTYAQRYALSTPGSVLPPPIDTAGASTSYLYKSGTLDPVSLATTAYGQGQLFLTPLSMLMIDSSVAADGNLYAPHLVKKVVGHGVDQGTIPDIAPALLGAPMSASTATNVRAAMRDVVQYGSVGASGGVIGDVGRSGSHIGGKTGTAQLASGQPHAWFISLAPDDAFGKGDGPARLAIVVMKEHAGEGACQAPVAQQIAEYALPLVK